jgi:ABC-type lipoprotein release transport system permease subunit
MAIDKDVSMILMRMGLKNLRRHFRRSLITVCSIGFGLATILWLQSILNGSSQSAIDTVTSSYLGHMQVMRQDYRENKLIQQTIQWNSSFLPQVNGTDLIATERVHLPALISSGEQSMPIILEGIDPVNEPRVTRVKETVKEGEFLEPQSNCENKSALISRSLAKLLNVNIGEKIVLLAQATDGSLGNELFRVRGLFDSGSPEHDKGIVLTNKECVQQIGAVAGVHEVAIKVKGKSSPENIRTLLQAKIPSEWRVLTWRDLSSSLVTMTTFNDASLILVSVILFVVISLGILNTFLVAVFERTKEFGVMMALGTPGLGVIGTVLWEAFFLGLASSLLGIFVAAVLITYHSKFGFDLRPLVGQNLSVGSFQLNLTIYPVIDWMGAIKATLFTWIVVIVATLYPAYRASQLRPAEAIRSA